MREILFRGKCIDTGEWVYGYYVRTIEENADHSLFEKDWIYDYEGWCRYEVMPETVGQCTGINDKNGQSIFEGDVVRYGYTVTYINGQDSNNLGMNVGFYTQRDDFESWAQMEVGEEYEIIGNIH